VHAYRSNERSKFQAIQRLNEIIDQRLIRERVLRADDIFIVCYRNLIRRFIFIIDNFIRITAWNDHIYKFRKNFYNFYCISEITFLDNTVLNVILPARLALKLILTFVERSVLIVMIAEIIDAVVL
jgi:hypothetical protein